MIKLIHILKEIEADQIDISDLEDISKIIDDEIEKASKQSNEAILTTTALILALPGIINGITKIAEIIAKKSGIDLKKTNNQSWYAVINKITEKIDDYLDTPFNFILRPFIKDNTKRQKIAKIFKAIILAMMSIMGSVDINSIKNTTTLIGNLAPEIKNELIQSIVEKNIPKLTQIAKTVIQTIIK
jgi:hypothetical protein